MQIHSVCRWHVSPISQPAVHTSTSSGSRDNPVGHRLAGILQILFLLKLDNQFRTSIFRPPDNSFPPQLTASPWLLLCYASTLIDPADKYIAEFGGAGINT